MKSKITRTIEKLQKMGMPELQWVDIDLTEDNPENPKDITPSEFEDLKRSISEFPEMLILRPTVCMLIGAKWRPLGGNQRRKALIDLGWDKMPLLDGSLLSKEQMKEFMVKDNLIKGHWDKAKLKEWDPEKLGKWGFDVKQLIKESTHEAQVQFSAEADFESNFVVLMFSKDIDFIQIQSLLGLGTVYAKRQNGKPWAHGIGRVVDGVKAIESIKKAGKDEAGKED